MDKINMWEIENGLYAQGITAIAGVDEAGNPWVLGSAASAFLTTVVNFFITALVLFCLMRGINSLLNMGKKPEAPAAPTTKKCPYCLSDIPIAATRCAHCTSELPKE